MRIALLTWAVVTRILIAVSKRHSFAALGVLAAVILIQGCATPHPTAAELQRANYGPSPSNYKVIIATYLRETLKDPFSAQVEFLNQPTKAWTKWSGELDVGYGVCVAVNARNSFGGYTGFELYYFLINRDRIIKPVISTAVELRSVRQAVRSGCDRVVSATKYSPKGASHH